MTTSIGRRTAIPSRRCPWSPTVRSSSRSLGGPLFWQADSSYVDFYRPERDTGDKRLDLQPRVALPTPVGTLPRSAAVGGGAGRTLYLTDNFEGESNNGGEL